MSSAPNAAERPVVIEAAMSPVVANTGGPEPTTENIVVEALACYAAGASVVHCHHDFSLSLDEAIAQCVGINEGILAVHPEALTYPGYMAGHGTAEQMRHLRPMAEAGVLRMFAFDPGLHTSGRLDDGGVMTRSLTGGTTFEEATSLVALSTQWDVPCSVGIFEPGALRWVRSFGAAGRFTPGTVVKFYFAGDTAWGAAGSGPTFGLPPTKEALDLYLRLVEGSGLPWIVAVLGGSLLDTEIARYALELGGHLRIGVEDPLRPVEATNAELVARARALAAEVGRPVADCADTRSVLAA
ncbi:3-keto-5-aminohexanoate cleavage protein [Pseudonocardia pini]|uniref:3-keto-5-aminohexanoate cleavage protein n=1 Tax=Pseudonocardia pini TaxID=2758030 RepID=UPI0015F1051A|nr:3-keto-5-aminohexanoate cleavage protein [Pseudonocardia pini]